MKRIALALLSFAFCFPLLSAQAQTNRRLNLRYHYIALRQAVCVQQWNRAIALVDELIASGQLPAQQTDQMVAYRFYLEQYRRNEVEFSAIPNCEGARGGTNPQNALPALNRTRDPGRSGS